MEAVTHAAKVIADSLAPNGVRLTTMEVVFPRIVLAEFNTHRVFSRNSASSRAIPVEKMIRMVQEDPFIPTHWGKNQKGMQADEELNALAQQAARETWLEARDKAIQKAMDLLDVGVHKQITNRLLEPFMWHTCIVTATEWDNFFHLRRHPAAHPEIRLAADCMFEAVAASEPTEVSEGDWHCPYIQPEEWAESLDVDWDTMKKVSTGRCARVSYLTHDGKRDREKDVELHDGLLKNGHMSPLEHVARPMDLKYHGALDNPDNRYCERFAGTYMRDEQSGAVPIYFCGNLRGWVQYRKEIPNEWDLMRGP